MSIVLYKNSANADNDCGVIKHLVENLQIVQE
jgi:hypothetical protein